MLRATLYQQSLLEVDPDEIRLDPASFERQLRELVPVLFSVEDFQELHPAADGAPTTCPLVLVAMLLLQFRFNVSDRELVERCTRDLGWRYAIGLERGALSPSTSTVVRFRSALRRLKGESFVFDRVLAHARKEGWIGDVNRQAMDSTNTDCRGAVIDTFNLVGAAIRQVLRRVAQALGDDVGELARRWNMGRYLNRSLKGHVAIDWSDEVQRNKLLTEEVADADRIAGQVARLPITLPPDVAEALALLRTVARQDVEALSDGSVKVARGTAPDRVISITDPEARHGRKSASKTILGFKTHVLGTIASQFVTGIAVTGANVHDAKVASALVEQATTRNLKPQEAVADAAYSAGATVRACAKQGVDVRTKLPSRSSQNVISKREFAVDLDRMTVTCPEGQTATEPRWGPDPDGSDTRVPKFKFERAICAACPRRAVCSGQTAKGYAREVVLSVHEAEHQRLKAFNARDDAKTILKSRSAVERLLSHLVRMGMRHARFFGMHMVQFQSYMSAAAYNLQRLIVLATKEA